MISKLANKVFERAIENYHVFDNVQQQIDNPYDPETVEHLLFLKCWIDTVQWHMEDIIRNPDIDPTEALRWKRAIDKSNQERTDTVEFIDSYFLNLYNHIQPDADAVINTESPAWAIDRLSILALKIYHMALEASRKDVSQDHITACQEKLNILLEQRQDLSESIDRLLEDIEGGKKYMKVYKQMKMYNDPELNPILYKKKKEK